MSTNAQFEAAKARFAAIGAAEQHLVGPAGESIALVHEGPAAQCVVLLHGLTASPRQFLAFGERLFKRGHNVLIPRLPLHGHGDRMTDALHDLSPEALRATVSETLASATHMGASVTVIGFSLGGLLAAWAAQRHPEIALAMCISPFVGVNHVPRRVGRVLARVALRFRNRFVWWNPVRRERLTPLHGYPRYPTHAIARLYLFAEEILREAERNAPAALRVLLVRNRREVAVNLADIETLAALWRRNAPGRVLLHDLDDLPASHDIIEAERDLPVRELVYPQLERLIDEAQL